MTPEPTETPGDKITGNVGEGAPNVAVGKNIVQVFIDKLHLPRWLLYSLAVSLLVTIGSLGWFGYLTLVPGIPVVLPPTPIPTLTPIPRSTALPFMPEQAGEVLIVIATFDRGEGVADARPHAEIQRSIQEEAEALAFANLRVEVEPTALVADDRAGADVLGERYNASLVIWGEESSVRITVNFFNRKEPAFDAADVQITETKRTFMTATTKPEPYTQFVTEELPRVLKFLTLFAVGQSYYTNQQYNHSAQMIERAVQYIPKNISVEGLPDAYFRLGWLYQEPLKDINKAINNYGQSLELVTTDTIYLYLYIQQKDTSSTGFNLSLDVYDALTEYAPQSSFSYIIRGNKYYSLQKYDLAIKDFDRAVTLDSANPMAYYYRGLTYRELDDSAKANADYQQATQLDPLYISAYNERGIIDTKLHKYQVEIVDEISKNVSSTLKRYLPVYNNRGIAYTELGELNKAMDDYKQILVTDSGYVNVYYNQGLIYSKLGQYENAIYSFHKYTSLSASDPGGWNIVCWWQSLTNFSSEVLNDCQKAVDLSNSFAPYRDSRGLARALIGDLTGAIDDFTAYVEWSKANDAYEPYGKKREAWIAALQRGENPFDEETLAELREE